MRVVVTGASGFVGRTVCEALHNKGHEVWRAVRQGSTRAVDGPGKLAICGDLASSFDARALPASVDAFVHCAGHVPLRGESPAIAAVRHRAVNLHGTMRVARYCAGAGVRRMVFLSSAKVYGESSPADSRFTESSSSAPVGAYAESKAAAEEALMRFAEESGVDVMVVRPPVVFGPGVGGNILRLLKLVSLGVPLPFGSIRNARSYVSVTNLADLVSCCVSAPIGRNQPLLISDDEDISTPDLILHLTAFAPRRVPQFSVSVALLERLASLVGARRELAQVTENFRLDISSTKQSLRWTPPTPLFNGLEHMARWFWGRR